MPSLDTALIVLAGIALFAAFVNGAIGYGFSSLTVPLAPFAVQHSIRGQYLSGGAGLFRPSVA